MFLSLKCLHKQPKRHSCQELVGESKVHRIFAACLGWCWISLRQGGSLFKKVRQGSNRHGQPLSSWLCGQTSIRRHHNTSPDVHHGLRSVMICLFPWDRLGKVLSNLRLVMLSPCPDHKTLRGTSGCKTTANDMGTHLENIYSHSAQEARRASALCLAKVQGREAEDIAHPSRRQAGPVGTIFLSYMLL